MASSVSIDGLADAIIQAGGAYIQRLAQEEKRVVDQVAKETNETIKAHVTFGGSGDYVKAFNVSTISDTAAGKTKIWHVKPPYHRLTHLLENGHALWQGGRTRDFPHIRYGQEFAEKRMDELTKEAAEHAGR